jgi:hypothetical protein
MRLESLFLAFSISSGCPSLEGDTPSTEVDTEVTTGLDDIRVRQNPVLRGNPGSNPDTEPEIEPVEGFTVFQQFETTDTPSNEACVLTFQTVGVEYDDKCADCVFAFEVDTKTVGATETDECRANQMDNDWLLRAYEADNAGDIFGVENIRLQFRQTVPTGDKVLTNVLLSVVDVYEYMGNGDEVDISEETTILAHDQSETGRAGVTDGRVWWTLDDGVTRIMASGVYAE